MKNILNDFRLAQRSASLRSNQDPNAVAAQLQSILAEALHVQASGSKFFADRALKEMKQIRQDMIAGQINAGGRTAQVAGTYGHVIDQLESLTKKSDNSQALLDKSLGSIKNAFPSTDTLIGALMTANPVLGYGVKIFRDISRSRKAAKSSDREERERRLNVLRQQEDYLLSQVEVAEQQEEVVVEEKAQQQEAKKEKRRGGIYRPLLEDIRSEIDQVRMLLENDSTLTPVVNDSPTNQMDLFDDTPQEQVEDLVRVQEEGSDRIVDAVNELTDTEKQLARERIRNERLSRVNNDPTPYEGPENLNSNAVSEAKEGPFHGILSLIRGLGMIGILGGGVGLLSNLLSPIKALFSFMGVLGKGLLSLGSKLFLPAAVITSLYSFFDGFFKADEILGKADSQISLGDRILVGVSNLISSVVSIFDYLLEAIGIDIIDTDGLTKKIYDFFDSIPANVLKLVDALALSIDNAYDKAVDSVVNVYDGIVDKFKDLYNVITGKLDGWVNSFKDMSIVDWLFSDGSTSNETMFDPNTGNIVEVTNDQYSKYGRGFGEVVDPAINYRSEAVKSMDEMASRAIVQKMIQQASTTAVNAPTANVTSVNNTIMQERTTSNNNPRVRLAIN